MGLKMKECHETQALYESCNPFVHRYLKLIQFQGSPLKMSDASVAQLRLSGRGWDDTGVAVFQAVVSRSV
jgi:hypothetical protein